MARYKYRADCSQYIRVLSALSLFSSCVGFGGIASVSNISDIEGSLRPPVGPLVEQNHDWMPPLPNQLADTDGSDESAGKGEAARLFLRAANADSTRIEINEATTAITDGTAHVAEVMALSKKTSPRRAPASFSDSVHQPVASMQPATPLDAAAAAPPSASSPAGTLYAFLTCTPATTASSDGSIAPSSAHKTQRAATGGSAAGSPLVDLAPAAVTDDVDGVVVVGKVVEGLPLDPPVNPPAAQARLTRRLTHVNVAATPQPLIVSATVTPAPSRPALTDACLPPAAAKCGADVPALLGVRLAGRPRCTHGRGCSAAVAWRIDGGLSNRIRVVVSYLALAWLSGCSNARFYWVPHSDCPSRFDELFEPIPGVSILDKPPPSGVPRTHNPVTGSTLLELAPFAAAARPYPRTL